MVVMTLGQRIFRLRKQKGLSQPDLGRIVGVTREAVSAWEHDKSTPTRDNMRAIAVALDTHTSYLETGVVVPPQLAHGLLLQGEIAAGSWREVFPSQEADMEYVAAAADPAYPAAAQYALRIRGDSVDRVAKDGAAIHCVDIETAGLQPRSGDLVVVERRRGDLVETSVKRFRRVNGVNQLWPESNNPAHQQPIEIAASGADIRISALVISVITPVPRGS